eukprot:695435-Pleurochrysis_carterae.AAC.2
MPRGAGVRSGRDAAAAAASAPAQAEDTFPGDEIQTAARLTSARLRIQNHVSQRICTTRTLAPVRVFRSVSPSRPRGQLASLRPQLPPRFSLSMVARLCLNLP